MNSNTIRLTGKFEIPEPLDIDHSYTSQITFGITGITKKSQENGEFEFTYHAKPEIGDIILKNGAIIKFKKKVKQSVLLRQQLMFIARERGIDEEKFYDDTMIQFRHNTLEILDFLEGLNNA